jgi:hypothetical protein
MDQILIFTHAFHDSSEDFHSWFFDHFNGRGGVVRSAVGLWWAGRAGRGGLCFM